MRIRDQCPSGARLRRIPEPEPEPDGSGEPNAPAEPQAWYVEDSLPEHEVGTFAEWPDGMVAEVLKGLAGIGLLASAH
ncbi:hypothetical protein ABH920_003586 [Catenulispora sp. EB89]|uniref:hypothetical protein n=1 Tax=Catenulispora sp. EB89 TaxID=3156257 RepID=UPI00351546FC